MNKKIYKIKELLRETLIPKTPYSSPINTPESIPIVDSKSLSSIPYINLSSRELVINNLHENNKILLESITLLYLFIVTLLFELLKYLFN